LFGVSLPVVVLAVGGLLYAAGTVGAYRVDEPGTGALAASTLLLTVSIAAGVAVGVGVPGLTGPWSAVVVTGGLAAALPWTVFVLQYTGNGELATRPRVAVVALPVVVVVAAVLSQVVVSVEVPFESPFVGGAVAVSFLVAAVLIFGATVLHLYTSLVYDSVRFSSGLALWLPLGAPAVGVVFSGPIPATLVAGTTLVGGGALVAGTVTALDVFDTTPAAGRYGRRRLADEITDPVAFLDADGDVIETNDAFERQFEVTETAVTGDPLPAVIGATLSRLVGADSVELITDEGRRQFAPRVSQLRDHRDRVRGTIVVLADITDQKLREQRLAVLNRVVRHNLRNELSVVRGFAEEIGNDGVSNDLAADRIVQASDNLITLGERAREAARLLDHQPETREVELGELANSTTRRPTSPSRRTCRRTRGWRRTRTCCTGRWTTSHRTRSSTTTRTAHEW